MKKFFLKVVNKFIYIFFSIYDFIYYLRLTKEEDYNQKQNQFFNNLNLNRKKAIKKFHRIVNQHRYLKTELSSEHQIFFSALSFKKNIKSILEIGTYDGKNSAYMAELFPSAKVVTIDLPDDDELYINSYSRQNKIFRDNFCKNRDNIIKKYKNLKFIKMNSLKLINHQAIYDLIWVDGAHGYPFVSIDIVNSLKLLSKKGILICDDIYTKTRQNHKLYKSIAGFETLEALKLAKIIKYKLLYKRIDSKINPNPYENKFIAIIKKINT